MVGKDLALWWKKGSSFLKQERNTFIDKFKDERESSILRTSIASEKGKTVLPAVVEGMGATKERWEARKKQ